VTANDRDSVYNPYPVFKTPAQAPAPAARGKLSPRAKAGVAVGGVALAATAMVTWSQYETGQADARVREAQITLQQSQINLALAQQQAQAAKASGQETPAQAARRVALEKCIAAAGTSYNGVADCASAYPAVDSGVLNGSQNAASSTPSSTGSSPVGLVVLGATGAVFVGGWAKKRLTR
jgi:hypothetical protein